MTVTLSCVHRYEPPVAVIHVTGSLGLRTVVELRDAVRKALVDEPEAVLLEASGLTVDDDVHLTILIALANEAAGWPSIPILICAATESVTGSMTRFGIDRHVMICASLDDGRDRAASRALPARIAATYPPTIGSVAAARRMVTDACRAWGLEHLAPAAELVGTELASNAVRHAGTPFHLSLTRTGRKLHVAVRDHAPAPARITGPDAETEPGGRGLLIVEALASRWGCTPSRDGKVTWATLPVDPR